MAAAATDIVSRLAEWSDSAFAAFCEDMAGMFGLDVGCERRQAQPMAVHSLREHFKKLTAVHVTKADGALNGSFQLIFDHGGLFILSGVIVMLPESRILEDVKRGTIENAASLQDAAREVGNLLVGSWDRVFREDCRGHEHFVKTNTFIGKPWDKPEQIELQANTEVVAVLYDMTIGSYPTFTCAAVFPRHVLSVLGGAEPSAELEEGGKSAGAGKAAEASARPAPTPESTPAPAQKPAEPIASEKPAASATGSPKPAQPPAKPAAAEAPASTVSPSAQEPSPAAVEEHSPEGSLEKAVARPGDHPSPDVSPTPGKGLIRPTPQGPAIDPGMLSSELASAQSGRMTRRPDLSFLDAAYIQSSPEAGLAEFLSTAASEIMEKEVIWAGPEDTVQDVIAKMQQHNVGYVLIGTNGSLEGLVSGSNILAAVSLYLRPMFAKWRRPQDDATLGVKVKWIMSHPVRTVRPDATVAGMIESMRRCGGRCLPVVDAKGAVQGMVTVFDILLRILESDKSVSWQGRPPQAPPLLM